MQIFHQAFYNINKITLKMKTKFTFFLSLMLSFNLTYSQLVLTQNNTAFTPGNMVVKGAATSGISSPVADTNKFWNYTNLSVNATYNLVYVAPSDTAFPTATYADTGLSTVFIPGKYYYRDNYYETNANGNNSLGYVVNEQRYGSISANPADSCIIPRQVCAYTQDAYLMPFPATMGTLWQANSRNILDFELTVSALGLSHASCQKITNSSRTDEIVGWGKMRIPVSSGVSILYDVLMQKRTTIQSDSFYLEGSPAPAQFLQAFGVTQGQSTTINRYLFWRENGRYPLLMFSYGSNNFTVPNAIYFDATAQIDVSSIEEQSKPTGLNIFPNPCNGILNINLQVEKPTQAVVSVYNLTGQLVLTKSIFSLPYIPSKVPVYDLPAGSYMITVQYENNICSDMLQVVKE